MDEDGTRTEVHEPTNADNANVKQEGEQNSPDAFDPDQKYRRELLYKVHETCPVHVGIVYGIQQLAESVAGMLGSVSLIHGALCGDNDTLTYAQLLNSMLVVVGLSSVLEICIGFRLPVMEGPSFAFLAPILAMKTIPDYKCLPSCSDAMNATLNANVTYAPFRCEYNAYDSRIREVAGSVMCAGIFQTLLGALGGVGFILDYVSSLTVCVTLMMLGLGVFESVADRASIYWPAALITVVMYVLFALIFHNVHVPIPLWSRKDGFHLKGIPIFRLFPSLLAIAVSWFFCWIMTVTDALPDDDRHRRYEARTDAKEGAVENAEWLFIPYPGHIGMPTFRVGLFVGFLGSMVASTFESLGDYYNLARSCDVPPPPKHAVNRGIAVEGLCTVFSGSIGGCLGTTTLSDVAGVIPVTGMASRMGWLLVALIFLIFGCLGKFAAALALCPQPVIAGFNLFNFGIVVAMGISHLQNVDLKSVRNLVILAFAIMLGMAIPHYAKTYPNELDTGNLDLNQVILILLQSNMFVGGIITFIFDNVVPGSPTERGMLYLQAKSFSSGNNQDDIDKLDLAYGLPFITKWLRRYRVFAFIPFLPPYDDGAIFNKVRRAMGRGGETKGMTGAVTVDVTDPELGPKTHSVRKR